MSKRWKRVLLIFGSLVLITSVVAGSWALRVVNSFRDEDTSIAQVIKSVTDPRSLFPGQDKITILLLGQDYNHDKKGFIYSKGTRADTIMLLTADLETKKINAVSIPRDSYVEAPDGKSGKINGTYARGGQELIRKTLEQEFGVQIDYTIVIKPSAVKEIVDAVGGVDVEPIDDMNYDDNWGGLHVHLNKGTQHISGEQAVGFVRFREVKRSTMDSRGRIVPIRNVKSSKEEGDLRRTARQQQLIRALVAQASTPNNLWNADHIVETGFSQIVTNMKRAQVLALTTIFRGSKGEGMKSATLPGTDDMSTGVYYFKLDPERSQATVDWLIRGNEAAGKRLIRVSIKNGTDVNGAAKVAAEKVGTLGYEAEPNGNADAKAPTSMVMYSKSTYSEAAAEVAQLLGAPTPTKVAETGNYLEPEVRVVIGSDIAPKLVPPKAATNKPVRHSRS